MKRRNGKRGTDLAGVRSLARQLSRLTPHILNRQKEGQSIATSNSSVEVDARKEEMGIGGICAESDKEGEVERVMKREKWREWEK